MAFGDTARIPCSPDIGQVQIDRRDQILCHLIAPAAVYSVEQIDVTTRQPRYCVNYNLRSNY